MCEAYNCLPESGGLLEQDSYLMYGLNIARKAIAERRALDEKRATDKARSKSGRI